MAHLRFRASCLGHLWVPFHALLVKGFAQAFIIKKRQYHAWLPDCHSLQKVSVRSSQGSFVKLDTCPPEAGANHFDGLVGPF